MSGYYLLKALECYLELARRILEEVAAATPPAVDVTEAVPVDVTPPAAAAKKKRAKKRWWVKPYWTETKRNEQGAYKNIIYEIEQYRFGEYENYMRISPEHFQEILTGVAPLIQKKDTNYRKCISPGERLAITLRFLASGDTYPSLQYAFRVQRTTICSIVKETCHAINEVFGKQYVTAPRTPQEWRTVAKNFNDKWNSVNTIGALDGKHIRIRKPRNGGSWYYNYKGYHSLILLALVDANYKFLWVDIGTEGRAGDAAIYNESVLKEAISNKTIGLPPPEPIPYDNMKTPIPYFIVADDAFALNCNLMKPYKNNRRRLTWKEDVFNYRLSRARRIVENTFGILVHRFRCLLTTLQQEPDVVKEIVMACCTLHNFCCVKYPAAVEGSPNLVREDLDRGTIQGRWQLVDQMLSLRRMARYDTRKDGKIVRDYLKEYYSSAQGEVHWQDTMVSKSRGQSIDRKHDDEQPQQIPVAEEREESEHSSLEEAQATSADSSLTDYSVISLSDTEWPVPPVHRK